MTRTLLAFGDSNTHGTPPITQRGVYDRFDAATRWPTLAAAQLGYTLVEEGLPGRTTCFEDPIMGAHMNGQQGLRIALCSHGPIDVMTLMLGTNDAKARFTTTPERTASGIASLLDIAFSDEMQTRHSGFEVLLIAPPPVVETGVLRAEFFGGAARSQGLAPLYAALAENYGCRFLDAGRHITVSPVDGVHFEAHSHTTLAAAVAAALS